MKIAGNFKTSLYILLMGLSFFCCERNIDDPESINNNTDEDSNVNTNSDSGISTIETHDDAGDYIWDINSEIDIELLGTSIEVNGSGATSQGSILTITSPGTYNIHGELTDGQIIVNCEEESIVRLILNNVNISSSTSSPINIENALKTMIVLSDGTTNYITDPATYVFSSDDDEPNAAIFSKANLTFYGEGNIVISSNYNDAINCKDGIVITSGTFNINSVDDGIRGKDYLVIKKANIDINAAGDGLKSDNSEDIGAGCILVEKGTINIVAENDAIQAANDIVIKDGDFTLTTGGGSKSSIGTDESAKALKATDILQTDGGDFTINAADDAIHSNNLMYLNSGNFIIASGDDGVHADYSLELNGADIYISESYEGLESKFITLNTGNVNIVSSDDGINIASGNDGSGMDNDPWNTTTVSGNYLLTINGGYYAVYANGDGIDANGSIEMTGGKVIVHGPTENMNGALDCDRTFNITGGFLLAVGSSGMAEAPDATSSQYCLQFNLYSAKSAGTMVNLQTSEGEEVFTFSPAKTYTSVVFSSPDLVLGASYQIYYGGTSTGTETDGLYSGGTYSPGSSFDSFTISSSITQINVSDNHPR